MNVPRATFSYLRCCLQTGRCRLSGANKKISVIKKNYLENGKLMIKGLVIGGLVIASIMFELKKLKIFFNLEQKFWHIKSFCS
jgi:hypothetical protein